MCDQTEIVYKAGEIVWCKLSKVWWPAQVQDQDNLDEEVTQGLRKKPLAVVKFFDEDYYDFVKDIKHICHYNSSRKMEFIKKGMDAHRSMGETNQMSKFPKDIVTAEKLTCGNPNILEDPSLAPEENFNYKEVFSTPKTLKDVKSLKKLKNSNVRNKINYPQTSGKTLGPEKSYFTKYLIQSSSKPSNNQFKCPDCNFVCTRVRLLGLHKSFNKFTGCPRVPTKYGKSTSLQFKLEKTIVKRKSIGNDTSSPAKKKMKSPAIKNDENMKKVKNAVPKEVKEKDKKKSEAMREQLLKDWNEEDFDDDDGTQEVEEVLDIKTDEKPQNVFDFEENDEDMNMDRSMRFGQKLPRVIPKEDKNKEGKLKERNPDQEDLLEEQFNSLMKETSVPVVPIMTDSFLSDSSVLPGNSGKAEAKLGTHTDNLKETTIVVGEVETTDKNLENNGKDNTDILPGDEVVEMADDKVNDNKDVSSVPEGTETGKATKDNEELVDDNRSLLHDLESDSPTESDSDSGNQGGGPNLSQSILDDLQTDSELLALLHDMRNKAGKIKKKDSVVGSSQTPSHDIVDVIGNRNEGTSSKLEKQTSKSRKLRGAALLKKGEKMKISTPDVLKVRQTSPNKKDSNREVKTPTKVKKEENSEVNNAVARKKLSSQKSPRKFFDNPPRDRDSPNIDSSPKKTSPFSEGKSKSKGSSDSMQLVFSSTPLTSDINSDEFHSSTEESVEKKIKMLISDSSSLDSQEELSSPKVRRHGVNRPKHLASKDNRSNDYKLKKVSRRSNIISSRKQSTEKHKSYVGDRTSSVEKTKIKSASLLDKARMLKNGLYSKKKLFDHSLQNFSSDDRKVVNVKGESTLRMDQVSKSSEKTAKDKSSKSSSMDKGRTKSVDIDKARKLQKSSRDRKSLSNSDSSRSRSADVSYAKSDLKSPSRTPSDSSPVKYKLDNKEKQCDTRDKGRSKSFRSKDTIRDSHSHKQDYKDKNYPVNVKEGKLKEKFDNKHEQNEENPIKRSASSESKPCESQSNVDVKQISPKMVKSKERSIKKKKIYDDAYSDLFKPDTSVTKIIPTVISSKPKVDLVKADKPKDKISKNVTDGNKPLDTPLLGSPKLQVSKNSQSPESQSKSSKQEESKERKKSVDLQKPLLSDKTDKPSGEKKESRENSSPRKKSHKDDENKLKEKVGSSPKTTGSLSPNKEAEVKDPRYPLTISETQSELSEVKSQDIETSVKPVDDFGKGVSQHIEVDSPTKPNSDVLILSVAETQNAISNNNNGLKNDVPIDAVNFKDTALDSQSIVKEVLSPAKKVSSRLLSDVVIEENLSFSNLEEEKGSDNVVQSKFKSSMICESNVQEVFVSTPQVCDDLSCSSLNKMSEEIRPPSSSPLHQNQDSVDRELEEMFSTNNQATDVSVDSKCKNKVSSSEKVSSSDQIYSDDEIPIMKLENQKTSIKNLAENVASQLLVTNDNKQLDSSDNSQSNVKFISGNGDSLDFKGKIDNDLPVVIKSEETLSFTDNSSGLDQTMVKEGFDKSSIFPSTLTVDGSSSALLALQECGASEEKPKDLSSCIHPVSDLVDAPHFSTESQQKSRESRSQILNSEALEKQDTVIDTPQVSCVEETVIDESVSSIPIPPMSEVVIETESADNNRGVDSYSSEVAENVKPDLNLEESIPLPPPIPVSHKADSLVSFKNNPVSSDFLTPDKIKEIFKKSDSCGSKLEPPMSVIRPIVVPPQAILEGNMDSPNFVSESSLLSQNVSLQDMDLDINSMPIMIDDSPEFLLPENSPSTSAQPLSSDDDLPPFTIKVLTPSDKVEADCFIKLVCPGTYKPKPNSDQKVIKIPPSESKIKASHRQLPAAQSPLIFQSDVISPSPDRRPKIISMGNKIIAVIKNPDGKKDSTKIIYSKVYDGKPITSMNNSRGFPSSTRVIQPAVSYVPAQNKLVQISSSKKTGPLPLSDSTKKIRITTGQKIAIVKPAFDKSLNLKLDPSADNPLKKSGLLKMEGEKIKTVRHVSSSQRGYNSLEPSTSGVGNLRNPVASVLKHDLLPKVLAERDVFHETNPPGNPDASLSAREQPQVSSSSNVTLIKLENASVAGIQPSVHHVSDESYRVSSSSTQNPSHIVLDNHPSLIVNKGSLSSNSVVGDSMDVSSAMMTQLTADINLSEIELPSGSPTSETQVATTFNDVSSIPLPPDPFTQSVSSTNLLSNPSDKFSKS